MSNYYCHRFDDGTEVRLNADSVGDLPDELHLVLKLEDEVVAEYFTSATEWRVGTSVEGVAEMRGHSTLRSKT